MFANGTDEDFYRLYVHASKELKRLFPDLLIGGAAVTSPCKPFNGSSETVNDIHPHAHDIMHVFIRPFERIIRRIVGISLRVVDQREYGMHVDHAAERAPLDFASWHIYSRNVQDVVEWARIARRELDSRGFEKTLSICDEWNFEPGCNGVNNIPPGNFER